MKKILSILLILLTLSVNYLSAQTPSPLPPSVVNTIAEYGEQVLGSNVTVPTTSTSPTVATDILSFTLPSAGTWDVDFIVRGATFSVNTSGANGMAVVITDNLNNVIANTELKVGRESFASVDGINIDLQFSATGKAQIVTTGATTYKIRGYHDGSGGSTGSWTAQSDNNGRTKVSWTKIAGQLPSTGTTVDYVNVALTANITPAANSPIIFQTIKSGNIPYNNTNGNFSLTAGETYKLSAFAAGQVASAYYWYDVTSGVSLGVNGYNAIGGQGSIPSDVIFTPTINTIVQVRLNVSGLLYGSSTIGNNTTTNATITQLGSSNITVTDNVALFGENNGIITGQTTTSTTFVDLPGSSFLLPSAGSWDVEYSVFTNNGTPGAGTGVQIANSAGVAVANSFSSMAEASGGGTTGSNYGKVRIITSSAENYKLQWKVSGGTATVYNNSTDTQAGGNSKISWNKIAGTLPSTGQTVDYINANLPTGTLVANGAAVPYVTQSGNIPNSGGVFTLTAGKTYRLTSNNAYGGAEGATDMAFRFRDITNNVLIGSPGATISVANAGTLAPGSVAEAIITPNTDITVRLENITGSSRTFGSGSAQYNSAWVTITQLGSTSNTVGTLPAVDQSSAGYFDIGNMRMQWGQGVATAAAPLTVNLAVPFANANYSLTGSVIAGGNHFWTRLVSQASSSFSMGIITATPAFTTGTFNWFAIGQKP